MQHELTNKFGVEVKGCFFDNLTTCHVTVLRLFFREQPDTAKPSAKPGLAKRCTGESHTIRIFTKRCVKYCINALGACKFYCMYMYFGLYDT